MSSSGLQRNFVLTCIFFTTALVTITRAQVTARFYLNRDSYSVGEPLMFTLEIKNETPDVVYLFPKMLGTCSDAFTFSMTGPGMFCGATFDPACSDETVEIPGGEAYTAEWPLDFCYHITRPGTYSVTISRPIRYSTLRGGIQSFPISSTMTLQTVPADPAQVEQTLQRFRADLQSPDPNVRHDALDVLTTTAPDYFYNETLRLARDPDPFKVEHAVGALGRMNTPEARQVLAEVITSRKLDNDDEQSARCHAIESLGNSGDVTYLAFLEPYIPRANTCEGIYSMTAVAKLGKGSVISLLQAQLQSPVQKQRWWAVRALRITNSPDAVDAIITALRDKDPEIRAHAATSLTELTGHSVTNAKQPSLTPIQLENAWLAWWHDHRQGTKINEYPGEICRMN